MLSKKKRSCVPINTGGVQGLQGDACYWHRVSRALVWQNFLIREILFRDIVVPQKENIMNTAPKAKLHLGAGEKYFEGYWNIDFPQGHHSVMSPRVDEYADIRMLDY